MATATCGHEVKEGISASIYSRDREGNLCLEFGTYCPDCILRFCHYGELASQELKELIDILREE